MKLSTPKQLVIDLLPRSICSVQVASVITDSAGYIFSWGWNSVGGGYGCHAEAHAIMRSNRSRLWGATITVAGNRRKSGNLVSAMPCEDCMRLIRGYGVGYVEYRSKDDLWILCRI